MKHEKYVYHIVSKWLRKRGRVRSLYSTVHGETRPDFTLDRTTAVVVAFTLTEADLQSETNRLLKLSEMRQYEKLVIVADPFYTLKALKKRLKNIKIPVKTVDYGLLWLEVAGYGVNKGTVDEKILQSLDE